MAIKNKCFIVLWTMLTLSAFCQENNYITYYNIRNQALAHKVEGNYQEAIVLYNRAFSSAFPFSEDIKHLINCYLNMKDTTNALQAMRLLIKSGYKLDHSLPLLEDDGTRVYSNYSFTLDELLNALLSKEYDSLRNEFLANNNKEANEYMKTIAEIEFFASAVRFHNTSSRKKLVIVQNASFGLKTYYLINLLKSNIDLSRKHTDYWEDVSMTMALIHSAQDLLNSPQDSLNKYLFLLEEHVRKGNLYPEQYVIIIDNLHYQKTGKSLYGMQRISSDDAAPIQDIENIDARREKLFLPPLWVYYKDKGYTLPKSYKSKKE